MGDNGSNNKTPPTPDTSESPPSQQSSPPSSSPPRNNSDQSPPPSSSPPSSSPPSSPPPNNSDKSPPPSSPPPSSPPPNKSDKSPPPSKSESPPKSSPPPASQSPDNSNSNSPSQSSPPPPNSNSPSKSSPPPPSNSSNKNSPPPPSDSQNDNNKNNNNGNNNKNGGNNNKWHPPPPPPSSKSSPSSTNPPRALRPPSQSSKSPGSSSSSPSSTTAWSIPIVAAAGAGVFIIMMLVIACFACRRKRRQETDQMQFYKGGDSDPYYTSQRRTGLLNDQGGFPPPPPGMGGQGGWPTPPLPPLSGQLNSFAMSQSDYSGQHGPLMPPPPPPPTLGFSQCSFTYEELAAATDGFSQQNLLGQGGFGYVHKGVLPNAKEIAVKSLKSGSGQGDREFQAEVEIISRVHHRHLVSLVGYCISGSQRLLVYEYLPNNTLEFHLHGKGQPTMDWPTRLRIALGSAKGLAYLHEDCHPRIIHRDIKTANILLDFNFDAKVADFGLAKLSSDNHTHVSTRIMGTFGYLAPEYASSGKLTEKSDVFSFGVMLLELITGRRPVDPTGDMEDSLVDWARPYCLRALEDGNFDEIADPCLERNYPPHEMARMVACATLCIRHSARRRAKMSQIVRALEGDVSLEDLNDGIKQGQASFIGGSSGVGSSSSRSSDYENSSYSEEMKRLKKMAQAEMQSGPFSSEFGGTRELGLNPSTSSSEYMLDSQGISPHVKPARK